MAVLDLNPMIHGISLRQGSGSPNQNGNREPNDKNDQERPEGIGEKGIHN